MTQIHEFTSDQKLRWWGYGEWLEEPDKVLFKYKNIRCRVVRMANAESMKNPDNDHVFGGHLCGYIAIPKRHFLFKKHDDEIDIECHGGLNYSNLSKCGKYWWIGFDCAHLGDLTPSIYHLHSSNPHMIELKKKQKERWQSMGVNPMLYEEVYRNISFCKKECRQMVNQLLQMKAFK